jgi:myo-inositol-1(or 4)-monophosphatase
MGFPYDKATNADNNVRECARLTLCTRGVRRIGSAALELAYVAAGRLDGFWELKLSPWDYLAGTLCVLEAGGQVSDYAGRPLGPDNTARIVASNGLIHADMLAQLAEARRTLEKP